MDSLDPAVPDDNQLNQNTTEPQIPQVNTDPNPQKPLIYEETPIIEPVVPQHAVTVSPPVANTPLESPIARPPIDKLEPQLTPKYSSPHPGFSFFGMIKNFIFIVVLFGLGIGLSMFVKQYMPNGIPAIDNINFNNPIAPTPTLVLVSSTAPSQFANWKSYQVTSGISKQPINGITYMLPSDILPPICDGGNCASSGTYLPGGTRLTVDARGIGQLLPDFRGKILTDQGGREFSMKDTTIAGRPATEFSGVFTGTTSGGYAFSRMRGVMIEVSDTLSVEFNHFTPTLVNADFTSDDLLFDKILQSVQITLPLPSPTLQATGAATPTL